MTAGVDARAEAASRRFLIRLEENTLRQRPLWVRLIIEFVGTFFLVVVAAGSGVINHYVSAHGGGMPISRAAAVIAPGAVVMAMIYALGPMSGLHINPAVTIAFTARATTSSATTKEMASSVIITILAQVLTAETSVGLNAVAVENERCR